MPNTPMTVKHKAEVMDRLRDQLRVARAKSAVIGRRIETLVDKLNEVNEAPTVG